MAIPTPRIIFACAIPAIVVILSYIWFKRKKELQNQRHLECSAQKSQEYRTEAISVDHRVPKSDFQKYPSADRQPLAKMVIETVADKEDPRLGRSAEEYESIETDSRASNCLIYQEVMQKSSPELMQLPPQYREVDEFQVVITNGSELRNAAGDVGPFIASVALQSPGPCNGRKMEAVKNCTDITEQLVSHDTCLKDSVLADGDTAFYVDMSNDSTILECKQDVTLAPQAGSRHIEDLQVLQLDPVEESQGSLDFESLSDIAHTSTEDSHGFLDVDEVTHVKNCLLDDSQCSLDVVGTPDVTHSSLSDSQCSLDVEDVSDPSTGMGFAPQWSLNVALTPQIGCGVIASTSTEAIPCSTDAELQPESGILGMELTPGGSSEIVLALKCSQDKEHTPQECSPDLEPTLQFSPDKIATPQQSSHQPRDMRPTLIDVPKNDEVSLVSPICTPVVESKLLVSVPPSPDVEATFETVVTDVALTFSTMGQYKTGPSDNCGTCTLTTTLIELEGSSTEAMPGWSKGGDGDPKTFCGPVSVPSPGLPVDEAELQKLVNCNSLSAYESSSHSPADDLLESPTTSNYSDLHSEGSSDSGKGGSDIHTPNVEGCASNFPYTALQMYEFEIPQGLCGRLIGVRGRYVNLIKSKSRANISIKRHPYNPEMKLCAVIGTDDDINLALGLIRKRFPASKFPGINMLQVNFPLLNGLPIPETLQLHLPDGVTCDVILSSLVTAGHFFVQQPTHPTYSSLSRLDHLMLQCYQDGTPAPKLPTPVEAGIICAASTMGGWYRAQVVYVYPDLEECEVKFVDYGGYLRESIQALRQIRSDFMTLPFQASECFLANVAPIDESQGWSMEAFSCFEEMAQGQILQAQIVSYSEDGIPYVHLYRIQGVTTTFINRQLVSSGYANWVENQA